jgi:hypothetical protein
MTSRTIRTSGDFNIDSTGDVTIKVSSGGNITFDTGSSGTTTLTGNLTVLGTQTTVNSTDMSVSDNTITVNKDETGAGVTLGTAGLIVERGTLPNASLIWNESATQWRFYSDNGTTLGALRPGSLSLLNGVEVNYIDDDTSMAGDSSSSLPTQHAVRTYVNDNIVTNEISEGDTSVIVTDMGGSGSYVNINIDGVLYAKQNSDGFAVDALSALTSNGNLTLSGNGTGQVRLNSAIRMTEVSAPTAGSGYTQFYASASSAGGTGLYARTTTANEELVSKRRALVFGLIL